LSLFLFRNILCDFQGTDDVSFVITDWETIQFEVLLLLFIVVFDTFRKTGFIHFEHRTKWARLLQATDYLITGGTDQRDIRKLVARDSVRH
jgi:hypothetical protein